MSSCSQLIATPAEYTIKCLQNRFSNFPVTRQLKSRINRSLQPFQAQTSSNSALAATNPQPTERSILRKAFILHRRIATYNKFCRFAINLLTSYEQPPLTFACGEQLTIYSLLSIFQIQIQKFLRKKVEKFSLSALDKIGYWIYIGKSRQPPLPRSMPPLSQNTKISKS